MKKIKQILTVIITVVTAAVISEINPILYKNTNQFVAYADDLEVIAEDDYEDFHWKVTSDGQLILSPKEEGSTAEISDFYITLENPDPLDIYNHYMEFPTPQPWIEYESDITSVVIEGLSNTVRISLTIFSYSAVV